MVNAKKQLKKITSVPGFRKCLRKLLMVCYSALSVIVIFEIVCGIAKANQKEQKVTESLAVAVSEKINEIKNVSLYVSSLSYTDSLAKLNDPTYELIRDYDNSLTPYLQHINSIELFLPLSKKIIISNFGMDEYSEYADKAFLVFLSELNEDSDGWYIRDYRKSLFMDETEVLSYVRHLPLYRSRSTAYLVINTDLNDIREIMTSVTDGSDYDVSVNGVRIISSGEPGTGSERGCTSVIGSVKVVSHAQYDAAAYYAPGGAVVLFAAVIIYFACYAAAAVRMHRYLLPINTAIRNIGIPVEDYSEDSFSILSATLASLRNELARSKEALGEAEPLIRSNLINTLLRSGSSISKMKDELTAHGILLPYRYNYIVILRTPEDAANEATRLAIMHNSEEMLKSLGYAYGIFDDEGSIAFLVNSTSSDDCERGISSICNDLTTAIDGMLSVQVQYTIVACKPGTDQLHEAYLLCRESVKASAASEDSASVETISERSVLSRSCNAAAIDDIVKAMTACDTAAIDKASAAFMDNEHDLGEYLNLLSCVYCKLVSSGQEPDAHAYAVAIHRIENTAEPDKIAAVIRMWLYSCVKPLDTDISADTADYVFKARKFIEEEYADISSVTQIAQHINVTPIYLNRIFKQITGMTVSEYLNNYRIEISKEMLSASDKTITEISNLVGYHDVRALTRFFKKYNNMTPNDYRKNL